MATVEARFWNKVQRTSTCWLWQGFLQRGYGKFTADWRRGPELAHRVAFRLTHGRDAIGFVCHVCDVPACVRPEHLYQGNAHTNMRDLVARGRHYHMKKTHCGNGHPLTPENVYLYLGRGRRERQCRVCGEAAKRRWRQAHRDEHNQRRRERRHAQRSVALHGTAASGAKPVEGQKSWIS